MKNLNDKRIEDAAKVAKEELIGQVKSHDTKRYDQILIENEERKNYYFVKYRSTAFSRSPMRLDFPLQKELVDDFETNFKTGGEVRITDDPRLIKKVIASGFEPIASPKYAGKKLVFAELKIATEHNRISLLQPTYYDPAEVKRETCGTCKGDKYNTCREPECRGQHIYDCSKCGTRGEIDCKDCGARGEYRCPNCGGRGETSCGACSGSGYKKDSKGFRERCGTCNGSGRITCSDSIMRDGMLGAALGKAVGKEKCGGTGIIRCSTCSATGKVTCSKCDGDGRIECKVCYDDHIDNRYGKVDCETCETAGELASITYIETEIKNDDFEMICTDGKPIESPDFSLATIKGHVDTNGNVDMTYKNLNGEKFEKYDRYSEFASKNAMAKAGISKDAYPKMLTEELYEEVIPCATFNYNHILSATFHDVSVLAIDQSKEVLYHSDPTSVASEPDSLWNKISEQFRKAFSTRSFKEKVDRKHEFFLMVHMAKADGIIEDTEKRFLSANISGLDGFTNKEKAELFGLMSADVLPAITAKTAYFSSKTKAEEVKNKLVELIAKADGEYEKAEKDKLEEINKAIEEGFKLKPYGLGAFFKTWSVSIPLITLFLGSIIGPLVFLLTGGLGALAEPDDLPISVEESTVTSTQKIVLMDTLNWDEADIHCTYIGETADGVPNGKGKTTYSDGTVYEGEYQGNVGEFGKGLRDGYGIYTTGSGLPYVSYAGTWVKDKKQGKGTMIFEDGSTYDGDFNADQWEGTGTLTYPDSSVYEGEFMAGLRHGLGKMTMADGSVYDGNWEENIYKGVSSSMDETQPKPPGTTSQSQIASKTEYFKIQDPDGYSNLRDAPNGEVIRKVFDSERFEVVGSEGNWKIIQFADRTKGYMHQSRVVKAQTQD